MNIQTDSPLTELLPEVYRRLYNAYGPQGWWPGDSPFEVIVGAILTQSTAWTNVEKALAAMRAAGCWSFEGIAALPESELAEIIRSSGYYNAKARKLRAFAVHVLPTEVWTGFWPRMLHRSEPNFCPSTASGRKPPTTSLSMLHVSLLS